jgi:hypothetical protein
MPNLCGVNQKLMAEALKQVKRVQETSQKVRPLPPDGVRFTWGYRITFGHCNRFDQMSRRSFWVNAGKMGRSG